MRKALVALVAWALAVGAALDVLVIPESPVETESEVATQESGVIPEFLLVRIAEVVDIILRSYLVRGHGGVVVTQVQRVDEGEVGQVVFFLLDVENVDRSLVVDGGGAPAAVAPAYVTVVPCLVGDNVGGL